MQNNQRTYIHMGCDQFVFLLAGTNLGRGAGRDLLTALVHLNDHLRVSSLFSSLLLSSLELSDTTIYQPYIRALLGTASDFF